MGRTEARGLAGGTGGRAGWGATSAGKALHVRPGGGRSGGRAAHPSHPSPNPSGQVPAPQCGGGGGGRGRILPQALGAIPFGSYGAGGPHPLAWPEHHFGRSVPLSPSPLDQEQMCLWSRNSSYLVNQSLKGVSDKEIWFSAEPVRGRSQDKDSPTFLAPGAWDAPSQGVPASWAALGNTGRSCGAEVSRQLGWAEAAPQPGCSQAPPSTAPAREPRCLPALHLSFILSPANKAPEPWR